MNQEQLQAVAQNVIDKRRPTHNAYHVLYVYDKRIFCDPLFDTPVHYHRLALLKRSEINEGLTPKRWNSIISKLLKLQSKGLI